MGEQGCRSSLSIGGDNLQFYPNFALFSILGWMNLDHDFFQVSKLSEDQKKGLHQKKENFAPQILVETCAQMHTKVKLLGGCRCRLYSNYSVIGGDTVKLLGEYISHPPSAPLVAVPASSSGDVENRHGSNHE